MVEAAVVTPRRLGPLSSHASVSVSLLGPGTRLSVRGGTEAARRIGKAFGLDLPTDALRASQANEKAALWLGPDEWQLMGPEHDGLAAELEAALTGEPGCVVDISHRQVGLEIVGAGATLALNAGCPLDLHVSAFPVGMCTRTVLAKADIMLWRVEQDRFQIGCWRSFAPYVFDFLQQAIVDSRY